MTLADKNLALLLEACKGVRISDAERASLEWLAGQEVPTVMNIARVLNRARAARPVLGRVPHNDKGEITMTSDEIKSRVAKSRAKQGLPPRIEDPATLDPVKLAQARAEQQAQPDS